MNDYAIIVNNVSKNFKKLQAVKNFSFKVNKTECFGILGPNGAGKTTLMSMLSGKTLRNDAKNSEIKVFGFDPQKNELDIKFFSGIVPQEDNLDEELNVIQNLIIFSKFYNIKKKIALQRIENLLGFMELTNKKDSKIKHLSGGMKRRLIIVRALLNNPKLLILDEPTTGLDPQARHVIWDKLRILRNNGVTIMITTHYMEEAFQLCSNIIMMHNGEKMLEGEPVKLITENIETYVLEIYDTILIDKIKIKKNIRIDRTENRFFLYSNNFKILQDISKKLENGNFYLRQSNLEDLFLKTTGRGLNE